MLRLFLLLFCLCSSLWALEKRNFMVFQDEKERLLTPDRRQPRMELVFRIARHFVSGLPPVFGEMVRTEDGFKTSDGKLRLTMWPERKMFSVESGESGKPFCALLKPTNAEEVHRLQEIYPFLTRVTGAGLPTFIVPKKAWNIISQQRTSYGFVLADVEIAEGKSLWELYKRYAKSPTEQLIQNRDCFFNGMFATTKALATFHVRSGFLNTQNTQENAFSLKKWICLLHGDAHLKNIFVTPDGKVTFIDWENAFKSLHTECHPHDEMEYFVWLTMCYWGEYTTKWPDETPDIVPFEIYVPFWQKIARVYTQAYAGVMRERYPDFSAIHEKFIVTELIDLFGGLLGRDKTFRIDNNTCLAEVKNPYIFPSWQQCLKN